jgi:amino acid transporter
MVALTTLINIAGVRVMSRINNIGVAAELLGACALIIVYLVHVNRGLGVLTDTQGTGQGHTLGYFGALLIGAIMPVYVMYGFDTAGSLAEETNDPQRRAPRAVIQALTTAGIMGFLLILFGTMAVSDKGYTSGSLGAGGLSFITTDVLGSTWGKVMLGDVAVAIFVCCLAIHAMSVRILFAMARDDNLPFARYLARVSGHRRVPIVPAIVSGLIALGILAININNQYAFNIIIVLGIILMYLAYAGVTIPLLKTRRSGWPRNEDGAGLFRLGRWGFPTNVVAVVYGLGMIANLMWPRSAFYGPRVYQQWGPEIFIGGICVAGILLWTLYQHRRGNVLAEHQAVPAGPVAQQPADA